MFKKVCLLVWLGLWSGNAVGGGAEQSKPVDIGSRLELFVDDFLIERTSGVELKLQRPRSAGKVLIFDRPWEGNTSFYVSVVKDDDRLRMYFRGSNNSGYMDPGLLKPGEKQVEDHPNTIGYAESRDGIVWERPSLGLYEFQGSRENSIVWLDKPGDQTVTDCMSVFKDGNPAAPDSQRYKALGGSSYPLIALVSSDGLRWTELQGQKSLIRKGLHRNAFDALNVAFWDSYRGRYSIFFRDSDRGISPHSLPFDHTAGPPYNYGNRSFKFSTSKDFVNWDMPHWVDFGGAATEHLYTNGTTPYFRAPHIYMAFPKRFQPWRKRFASTPYPGASEAVFLTSRDGLHWDRRFMEAFVRPGRDQRNWTHRNNLVGVGVHPTAPDEISLYVVRNYNLPSCHVERMVLRTDGFVSVHAGYPGGELVTKPIVFQGENLFLNYATSAAGSIRLEIQDLAGNPLAGFALEESPLIWGDEIEEKVRWVRTHAKGTSDRPLRRIAGSPVRLRFVMKDADLYSIRFK